MHLATRLTGMQMVTSTARWAASAELHSDTDAVPHAADAGEAALLAWAADRATVRTRHLVPLSAVGRLDDGRLVVELARPLGTVLPEALDVLGTPTLGVAVTLTVPLLEIALAERSGALRLGTGSVDDVLVDDAGAVVFVDRPPGAHPSPDGSGATATSPGGSGATAPSSGRLDGSTALVLAARTVWERIDPRDEVRVTVEAALAAAVHGDFEATRHALDSVVAAAPPRPVRWRVPEDDVLVRGASERSRVPSFGLLVRDLVERGIPIGARRVPVRHVLVGTIVAAGLTAAAVFALG